MVSSTKKLVESYILKYVELQRPNLKINKNNFFICPFHEEHEEDDGKPTCKMFTKHGHVFKCFNPIHNKYWNIFDLVRKFEPEMKEFSDDDIAEYLTHLLDIKSNEEIDKLLMMYHDAGFGLIALSPNSKNPVAGQSWLNNTSYEISQWREWINNGLGLGLRLGDASKVVAIDIDSQEALDKMRDLMGDTFMQMTKRGCHFIYSYEPDFDGINHQNFRTKGLEAELRANNAYIVVAPTLVDNFTRYWNYKKILPMPAELKKYILSLIDKTDKVDTEAEKMPDETLRGDLKGLDGRCNDTFIKMGGVLRKKLPLKQTEYALLTFNKLLAEPLAYKDIKGMMYQISRYNNYDQKELADEVLNHLKLIQQSTARDLQASLGFEKKNIEEVLSYLVDEGKLVKNKSLYKIVNKIEWEEDFMSIRNPLKFNVPYFHNYANFDMGDMIVIGAKSGTGKSHLACNFVKQFVEQGIKPNLICTEAGSKFGIILASLGIKVGDVKFKIVSDPSSVELEDDAVTILDWISAQGDYSQMEQIYARLNDQLVKHGGFLIVFAQLKQEDGSLYADSMSRFYASLVAKYNWSPIKNEKGVIVDWDARHTYFHTEKIRDSKTGKQYLDIPMEFNPQTKLLSLRGK